MPNFTAQDHAQAAKIAAKMFAQDGYSQHLGIEIVRAEMGFSLCTMTIDQQHLNGHGTCHGGAIFSLADTTFAHICNAHNLVAVAHICTIAYWQPARLGDKLYALAYENGVHGRSGSYRIEIRRNSETGECIAEFQGFSRSLPQHQHFPNPT